MDAELISSLLFRQIETAVRVFIQLGNGSRGADGSDADAAGNLALGTGNLADLTHKTVQEKFQILLAEGRIDQNREFIAAQPAMVPFSEKFSCSRWATWYRTSSPFGCPMESLMCLK